MADELVMPAENSVENSKEKAWLIPHRFVPGKSGNPGGRPKKYLTEALKAELERDPERAPKIARKLIEQAEAGDVQSFDRVRDSVEGRPAQSVNVNGDIDFTITDRRSRLTEAISRLRDTEQ